MWYFFVLYKACVQSSSNVVPVAPAGGSKGGSASPCCEGIVRGEDTSGGPPCAQTLLRASGTINHSQCTCSVCELFHDKACASEALPRMCQASGPRCKAASG